MSTEDSSKPKERPGFLSIMMQMAHLVAQRSTCYRLAVGTVIASADFRQVYAMGYNGNASGLPNCCDRVGKEAVGNCGCVHSEANAVINCTAPRQFEKMVFISDSPCEVCAKYLVNLGGVTHVYYDRAYRVTTGLDILDKAGISVHHITPEGHFHGS